MNHIVTLRDEAKGVATSMLRLAARERSEWEPSPSMSASRCGRGESGRAAKQIGIWLAILLPLAMLTGCTTFNPDDKPLKTKYSPRWELNEVPYEEVGVFERSGRNVRDGLTGIVDNLVQGVGTAFIIVGTSGYIVQKAAIIVGDVVGLVDDNPYSEHVFKGVISKQFLKFGSSAQQFLPAVSGLHEHTFEGPKFTILDYVGPEYFHNKVYLQPSGVGTFVGVVVGDILIRPAGNFALIFGAKETAAKIDKYGLDFIQASTEIPFL